MVKEEPIVTKEDLTKILNVTGKGHPDQEFRMTAVIQLLAESGCRISEATRLKSGDVDLDRGLITFRTTKNKTDRRVPVTKSLLSKLKKLTRGRQNGDLVFRVHRSTVDQALKRRVKRAGINKKIHCHSLRHNFITSKIRRKQPIPAIQAFVGHKSLSSTSAYCHFANEDDLRRVLEA